MIWTGLTKWPDWSFLSNYKKRIATVSEASTAVIGQYAIPGYARYTEQADI